MDDELAKDSPKIQADNQSIAIGEINISGTVTGNITIGHTIVQPADARLRHDLGILLKNVQTTWIKGVLEKSVHEAALLELGLELREEAVDNPWRMVMEAPDQTRETLPRGRRIKDIFDEANRLLLILGEPGSGKTTTLLQLARDLIAEVDEAFTQPVPVILNLSTWTNKQQPLDEWMIAELNSKYRVPKKDGQRWLKERRILPLLDGLDEVRTENRAACVERINQLVTDYGLQGLVVCSRIKEYTALDARLAFYRAIYIQPLTPKQVDEYLERAGDKLASLRATLENDEALRSMAQSPLILNIMSLAYQNTSAEALSDPTLSTEKSRRQHLFDTYIARMFNRKASARPYEHKQTKQYLSWLARNMQRHNQDVFLIEGLQPSWLPARSWQWIYAIVSRSGSMVILSLLVGGLLGRLIIGLSIGFIDTLRFEWLRKRRELRNPAQFWWLIINIVIVSVTVWLLEWLIFVPSEPMSAVVTGLVFGSLFGVRGAKQNLENDIQTVEALRWSWRMALKAGLIGGILGLIVGLTSEIYGSSFELNYKLVVGLFVGLLCGVIFGLLGAIFYGLRREIIETKSHPNDGVRLSIRNAILGGLIAELPLWLFVLIPVLIFGPSGERPFSFSGVTFSLGFSIGKPGTVVGIGPIFLLISALWYLGALWYGGLDVIQHYTLRLILLIQGHTPANYARFLDYAVDRIFLQKVGGGYRFIHRLLLEHFADMGETREV